MRRGLVVHAEDSWPKGCGFKSRHHNRDHVSCTIHLDQMNGKEIRSQACFQNTISQNMINQNIRKQLINIFFFTFWKTKRKFKFTCKISKTYLNIFWIFAFVYLFHLQGVLAFAKAGGHLDVDAVSRHVRQSFEVFFDRDWI